MTIEVNDIENFSFPVKNLKRKIYLHEILYPLLPWQFILKGTVKNNNKIRVYFLFFYYPLEF